MTEKKVEEFLRESNAIEREYSDIALQDSLIAWNMAITCAENFSDYNYVLKVHQKLMRRLNPRIAGKIRSIPIYVRGQNYCRECLKPKLIKRELTILIESWNENKYSLKNTLELTKEEFVKDWHIKFEGVHPFEDGNGRTGRILMNVQRLSLDLPLLIIHEGNEQYEYYKWFGKFN